MYVFRTMCVYLYMFGELHRKYFHLKMVNILMVVLCIVNSTLKKIVSWQ